MAYDNKINHEDLIMKKAMAVFAEDGLKFLGIEGRVKFYTNNGWKNNKA